jgi:hypothetical protein
MQKSSRENFDLAVKKEDVSQSWLQSYVDSYIAFFICALSFNERNINEISDIELKSLINKELTEPKLKAVLQIEDVQEQYERIKDLLLVKRKKSKAQETKGYEEVVLGEQKPKNQIVKAVGSHMEKLEKLYTRNALEVSSEEIENKPTIKKEKSWSDLVKASFPGCNHSKIF